MANILIGQEVLSPVSEPRSQGYLATHVVPTGSSSWNHTSYMNRSFISFSFGGRWIDDWGLIATIDGDRMQRAGSANFEDLISTYDVTDGQFYWGTHYNANEISFILSTDRITQKELDDFRQWFCAGRMEELILAEHPNRAIIARIAEPLNMSVLPFEEKTTVKIAGQDYETSTTIYKGDINLRFIMDEPFWYAKNSYLSSIFQDANNITVETLKNKDALKIILEDNIPISTMFDTTMLLGDNKIYMNNEIIENEEGVTLNKNENKYLYYPGNAPGTPIISFSFTPIIDKNTYYITSPRNSFTDNIGYDTLTFESNKVYQLHYTLPSAYVGYNQAIKIFSTIGENVSYVDLRRYIRDNVTNKHARNWALLVVDSLIATSQNEANSLITTNAMLTEAKKRMQHFICYHDTSIPREVKVIVNCKEGIASYLGGYRIVPELAVITNWDEAIKASKVYEAGTIKTPNNYGIGSQSEANNYDVESNPNMRSLVFYSNFIPRNTNDFINLGDNNIDVVEDSGDMLRSAYLKLEDKNSPTSAGKISAWNNNEKTNCYKIFTNTEKGLRELKINYKYMYY